MSRGWPCDPARCLRPAWYYQRPPRQEGISRSRRPLDRRTRPPACHAIGRLRTLSPVLGRPSASEGVRGGCQRPLSRIARLTGGTGGHARRSGTPVPSARDTHTYNDGDRAPLYANRRGLCPACVTLAPWGAGAGRKGVYPTRTARTVPLPQSVRTRPTPATVRRGSAGTTRLGVYPGLVPETPPWRDPEVGGEVHRLGYGSEERVYRGVRVAYQRGEVYGSGYVLEERVQLPRTLSAKSAYRGLG